MKQAAFFFLVLMIAVFAHANTVVIDLTKPAPMRQMPPTGRAFHRSHDCHAFLETRKAAMLDEELHCEQAVEFWGKEACDRVKNCNEKKFGCVAASPVSIGTCNAFKKDASCKSLNPNEINPVWYSPVKPEATSHSTFTADDQKILSQCEEAKQFERESMPSETKAAASRPRVYLAPAVRNNPAGASGI